MSDVLLSPGMGGQSSCIILDIGTQSIRVGYGGDDLPKSVLPTCIGVPNTEVDVLDSNRFGNAVFPLRPWEKRDYIEVVHPLQYNAQEKTIDINEDYFTKMVQEISSSQKSTNASNDSTRHNYIFEPFDDKMSGHSLVIPIHPTLSPSHSAKISEIAFEKLEVSSLFTSRRPVLSCFSCGRTSGVVVDIGAATSNVSCVQDGHCIQKSIQEYPVAGDFLDNEIYKKIHSKANIIPEFGVFKGQGDGGAGSCYVPLENVDASYLNWGVMHVIREIKHSSLFFPNSQSPAGENNGEFYLPDGSTVDTTSIRNTIPNLLFKSINSSQGYPGIVQMVINSINETSNVSKEISNITSSIVLSGGTTLISGFETKLHQGILDQKSPVVLGNSVSFAQTVSRNFSD